MILISPGTKRENHADAVTLPNKRRPPFELFLEFFSLAILFVLELVSPFDFSYTTSTVAKMVWKPKETAGGKGFQNSVVFAIGRSVSFNNTFSNIVREPWLIRVYIQITKPVTQLKAPS